MKYLRIELALLALTAVSVDAWAQVGSHGTDAIPREKSEMRREIKTNLRARARAFFELIEPEHLKGSTAIRYGELKEISRRLLEAGFKVIDSSKGEGKCIDQVDGTVPISSRRDDVGGEICFDLELLVNGPREWTKSRLVGAVFHEFIHQAGDPANSNTIYDFETEIGDTYRNRNRILRNVGFYKIFKDVANAPARRAVQGGHCVNVEAMSDREAPKIDLADLNGFRHRGYSLFVGQKQFSFNGKIEGVPIPRIEDVLVIATGGGQYTPHLEVSDSFSGALIGNLPLQTGQGFLFSPDCWDKVENPMTEIVGRRR